MFDMDILVDLEPNEVIELQKLNADTLRVAISTLQSSETLSNCFYVDHMKDMPPDVLGLVISQGLNEKLVEARKAKNTDIRIHDE